MIQVIRNVNWKIFGILLAGGLLGVAAAIPFMIELVGNIPAARVTASDLPLAVIALLALVQNGVLLSAAILTGMILSARVGLRMPIVHAWATGERAGNVTRIVLPGVLVGGAVGAVMVGLEAMFFVRELPSTMLPLFEIPLWKRLLAGIAYGGITEELFMRLFLMSTVVWLLGRWWKNRAEEPAPGAFHTAIFVVALLFGLGHLPATAALAPLTPPLVVRALVLNGVAGAAFGYLFWRRGLESAIVGHMGAHLVMQIPGTMLLTRMS